MRINAKTFQCYIILSLQLIDIINPTPPDPRKILLCPLRGIVCLALGPLSVTAAADKKLPYGRRPSVHSSSSFHRSSSKSEVVPASSIVCDLPRYFRAQEAAQMWPFTPRCRRQRFAGSSDMETTRQVLIGQFDIRLKDLTVQAVFG